MKNSESFYGMLKNEALLFLILIDPIFNKLYLNDINELFSTVSRIRLRLISLLIHSNQISDSDQIHG